MWSEFIAQYYTLKMTEMQTYTFDDVVGGVADTLTEVHPGTMFNDKSAMGMACAYMLTCEDAETVLKDLDTPGFLFDDGERYAKEARRGLKNCAEYLYNKMQTEEPWKITEEDILMLGEKFMHFKAANFLYHGEGLIL